MDINIENLLDKVSDHVKTLASTDTILGEEFTLGEFTCRPVIKVGTGFGSGAGTGKDPKSTQEQEVEPVPESALLHWDSSRPREMRSISSLRIKRLLYHL